MHFKIFLWNDEGTKNWRNSMPLVDEGTNEKDFIVESSATKSDQVIATFNKEKPDVVVLDIMSGKDPKMGLKLAELIRKVDLLVPIIAVTREPRVVYQATDKFEELGFSGVYDASVMELGVFEPIALRPSLNYWHSVVPEFMLVRRCLHLLEIQFGNDESEFRSEFGRIIKALPFSGSTESWHQQVRKPLASLMRKRGHQHLAEKFEFLADIFEKADPFYMAASSSRRHLSHNVQVFLLGLAILVGCEPIRDMAVDDLRRQRRKLDKSEALVDAILIWACIANTHDTAYLSEHFTRIGKDLASLSEIFAMAFSSKERPKTLKSFKWPGLHHGEVAARLWNITSAKNYERAYIKRIADGIARHDSKHYDGQPAELKKWYEFLAVLSDELQDWGRDRPELTPGARPFQTKTWSMFCLEGVEVGPNKKKKGDDPGWRIGLTFIARDHPEVIAKSYGSDGEQTVRDTFDRITKGLWKNLRSSIPILVELTVHFVSRPNANPFRQPVKIHLSEPI